MQSSIFQDLKSFILSGNMVTKLIMVNLGFSILLFLMNALIGNISFTHSVTKYFLVSENYIWDLTHPWVILTHLFVSNNLMDLIWNMLILYWFGSILGDMVGDDKVLPVYILGGVFGALVYIFVLNIIGIAGFGFITGCNTAVLSLIVASAVLVPNYNIRLLIFGNVELKIVVIIYVLLQLVYAYTSYNNLFYALLGGVLFGWLYIYSFSKVWRLDLKFNNFLKAVSFKRSNLNKNLSVKYKSKGVFYNKKIEKSKKEFDKKLDDILKKIKEKGYESLTESEKEFLFLASKNK